MCPQKHHLPLLPPRVDLALTTGTPFRCDWHTWRPVEHTVLTFIRVNGKLLLITKKRGLGAGKISTPGGRIEPGETAAQAAVRETEEEVGLTPLDLCNVGTLSFVYTNGHSLFCTVFTASSYRGTPLETPEAAPFWCAEADIPYGRMWSDDRVWLPLLLDGRGFDAWFIFEDDLALWHQIRVKGAQPAEQ